MKILHWYTLMIAEDHGDSVLWSIQYDVPPHEDLQEVKKLCRDNLSHFPNSTDIVFAKATLSVCRHGYGTEEIIMDKELQKWLNNSRVDGKLVSGMGNAEFEYWKLDSFLLNFKDEHEEEVELKE